MYTLKLPCSVFSGQNALGQIASIVKGFHQVTLFTDQGIVGAGLSDKLRCLIEQAGCHVNVIDHLTAEPTLNEAQEAVDAFHQGGGQAVIGLGGGSVMDVAKLASLQEAKGGLKTYLEQPSLARKAVPLILIPTTAGTGAEATPNAIVALPELQVKVGIVSREMVADYVILDPAMTASTPKPVAAAACVDALAHAIECYTSKKATPFSDLFAMEAMKLIFRHGEAGCIEGEEKAREALLVAAFYAGVAIAASGTTAVHALSYPLGGRFHIAHGVANAILLAPVMRFNEPAVRGRLANVCDMALGFTEESAAVKAQRVIGRIEEMVKALAIPQTLSGFNVTSAHLDELVASALQVTRLLDNNPRVVLAEDACRIYSQVL